MIKKIVVTIILIMFMCVSAYAAVNISIDFEGGVKGEAAEGANGFTSVNSDVTFDDTYTHGGSMACKLNFTTNVIGTGGEIEGWSIADVVGKETWFECWFYYGDAGDNVSGKDWSWSRTDTGQAGVQKMMRLHKRESDNSNNGFNSIYGRSSGFPKVDLEFTVTDEIGQDSIELVSGRWYRLRFYCKYGTGTDGAAIFQIDDTIVINETGIDTADDDTDNLHYALIHTYWNGYPPQAQSDWVDDISLVDTDPGWFTDNDPNISGITPEGDIDNNDSLTVDGNYFGSSQGNGWVQISDVTQSVSLWTDTGIGITVVQDDLIDGTSYDMTMYTDDLTKSNDLSVTFSTPSISTPKDKIVAKGGVTVKGGATFK